MKRKGIRFAAMLAAICLLCTSALALEHRAAARALAARRAPQPQAGPAEETAPLPVLSVWEDTARRTASAGVRISAESAIVMDADTGAVLFEKNADHRAPVASTTKIMTGLLVCRRGGLDQVCAVPDEAVGVEGSSMYLRTGETLTRRDLLYGLMLSSGNDAATALAILCSGSEAAFVEEMNALARELGLENTLYSNPHGLDIGENYSTARDLAVLTRSALGEETLAAVTATKTVSVAGDRTLVNHNRLLWEYEGCIGVKTGYTKAAGRILVSAARRGGRTLICVTIRDPRDWQDHKNLLDQSFAQYHETPVAVAGQELLRLNPRTSGLPEGLVPGMNAALALPLMAAEDFSWSLLPGEELGLRYRPGTEAPLRPGGDAGTVEITVDGRPVGSVPVTWGE